MAQDTRRSLRALLRRSRRRPADLHRRLRLRTPGRILRRHERGLLHRTRRARARLARAVRAARALLPAGSGGAGWRILMCQASTNRLISLKDDKRRRRMGYADTAFRRSTLSWVA